MLESLCKVDSNDLHRRWARTCAGGSAITADRDIAVAIASAARPVEARSGAPVSDGPISCERGLAYMSPGCDGSIAPMCKERGEDAALHTYCACDGRTVGAGELGPSVPYRHTGECSRVDAGPTFIVNE